MTVQRYIIGMLFSVSWMLSGCSFTPAPTTAKTLAPPPSIPSVTAPAVEAVKEAQAAQTPTAELQQTVSAMPDSTLRTKALSLISTVMTWEANNLAKWNAIVVSAQAQDNVAKAIEKAVSDRDADSVAKQKQIDTLTADNVKLKAGDPNAQKLFIGSMCFFALAGTALVVGIWIGIPQLKIAAFIFGCAGVLLQLLSRFVRALDGLKDWEVLLGGLAVAAVLGFVWWMLHRKVMPIVAEARAQVSAPGAAESPLIASTHSDAAAPITGGG